VKKKRPIPFDFDPYVEFIGGGRALTKEDEEAISAVIKARKLRLAKTKGKSVKS
jgi:hypothetical protein